jgi:hypothetical protein
MKWKLRKGYVENESSRIVCILPQDAQERDIRIIQKAPEMVKAMNGYVNGLDNGSLAARKFYNEFKEILSDIPVEEED